MGHMKEIGMDNQQRYLTTRRVELRWSPEVKAVIRAGFPSYRRRTAYLGEFSPRPINSYWDGGIRDEFAVVHLDSLSRHEVPTASHPYFDIASRGNTNRENDVLSTDRVGNLTLKVLPDGYALVQSGVFRGKQAMATVFVPASNLNDLLPGFIIHHS